MRDATPQVGDLVQHTGGIWLRVESVDTLGVARGPIAAGRFLGLPGAVDLRDIVARVRKARGTP